MKVEEEEDNICHNLQTWKLFTISCQFEGEFDFCICDQEDEADAGEFNQLAVGMGVNKTCLVVVFIVAAAAAQFNQRI